MARQRASDEQRASEKTTSGTYSPAVNTSGRRNRFRDTPPTVAQSERMRGNSRETDIELPSHKKKK